MTVAFVINRCLWSNTPINQSINRSTTPISGYLQYLDHKWATLKN